MGRGPGLRCSGSKWATPHTAALIECRRMVMATGSGTRVTEQCTIMKYVQVCTCATSRVFTEPFWVKTMEYLTPRNFLPIKISGFCKIFWKPKIYATINTPSLFHTH